MKIPVLALIITASAFAQAPQTSANLNRQADAAHAKMVAAQQKLEKNPDYVEWTTERQKEAVLRNQSWTVSLQEKEIRRQQDEAKKPKHGG